MVEYKQNPATGEFVLMEINGRFWGSLPLAVAAGVDFPYDLYQLLMKQQPATPHSYKIGLYSRNVGKDIGWLRQRLSGAKNYSVAISLLIKQLAQGFWNTLLGRERWDTITIDDPLPGLVETLNVFVTAFKRSVSWIWRGVLAILASNKIWRRMQRIKVRRALEVHPNLLFICRGNICRSPFAEAYAKLRMDSLGIRTISAGTYPQEKRPAPEPAQCASREFGVVLDCHRSRSLEVELIKWAGAVVCMDYRDYSELRRVYPEVRNKLFFLAPFDLTTKDFEIADPWGKPVGEFRVAYKQISSSIEGLIESLVNT